MLESFLFIMIERVASFGCSISFSPDELPTGRIASEPTSWTEYAVPKVKCLEVVGTEIRITVITIRWIIRERKIMLRKLPLSPR
jgi:hypothetical protein